MVQTFALIGAGRMGGFLARQLPPQLDTIVIDTDAEKAAALAAEIGARHSASIADAASADVAALVLPAPAIPAAAAAIAPLMAPGAVLLNMATEGVVENALRQAHPALHIVDAKIIGHAKSMAAGADSVVVAGTEDEDVLARIAYCLPGYSKVVMGDASIVPVINRLGSAEGIRAAVSLRKQVQPYGLPQDWVDTLINTVCAGTMRAYVDGDLGEFARKLAEKLEKE